MNRAYLPCYEVSDFLMAYLDGDLDGARRAEFDRHLQACPPCREYLRTYEQTVRLSRMAFADPGPVPEDLVRAILAARGGV